MNRQAHIGLNGCCPGQEECRGEGVVVDARLVVASSREVAEKAGQPRLCDGHGVAVGRGGV